MATREQVYTKFGEVAELAQLLETELGSLLLADEGLRQGAYALEHWESGHDIVAAINRRTLGGSLAAYRKRFSAAQDVDQVMDDALAARNRLTHGFYLKHARRIETPDGCDDMISELERTRTALWPAYEFAATLADLLLQESTRLRAEHLND